MEILQAYITRRITKCWTQTSFTDLIPPYNNVSTCMITAVMITTITADIIFCVRTATCYRLHSLGFTPQWWRHFLHLSRLDLGPTQPPAQWVLVSIPGVKQPVYGVNHPFPFSTEVKERVELYLHSPCGSSWPVMG